MDPRPYQAEAFDAARKSNIVMVGATGVGKVNSTCPQLSRNHGPVEANWKTLPSFPIFEIVTGKRPPLSVSEGRCLR